MKNLGTMLCETYDKLATTLQVYYENVKFVASRETLWQRLSLVE